MKEKVIFEEIECYKYSLPFTEHDKKEIKEMLADAAEDSFGNDFIEIIYEGFKGLNEMTDEELMDDAYNVYDNMSDELGNVYISLELIDNLACNNPSSVA